MGAKAPDGTWLFSQIPYSTEQGTLITEQGILLADQGIFRKQKGKLEPSALRSDWRT
jgi:hypothetical protein